MHKPWIIKMHAHFIVQSSVVHKTISSGLLRCGKMWYGHPETWWLTFHHILNKLASASVAYIKKTVQGSMLDSYSEQVQWILVWCKRHLFCWHWFEPTAPLSWVYSCWQKSQKEFIGHKLRLIEDSFSAIASKDSWCSGSSNVFLRLWPLLI